ncbi:hypothetical protein M8J75_004125 [Diaphorina citri]|nr:hypothetical protein M8J75_004125 [Diaphorina citri]
MQPRGSCASCMQAHVNFIPEHSPQYYSVLMCNEDISEVEENIEWEVRNYKDMGNFQEEDEEAGDEKEEEENKEKKEEERHRKTSSEEDLGEHITNTSLLSASKHCDIPHPLRLGNKHNNSTCDSCNEIKISLSACNH